MSGCPKVEFQGRDIISIQDFSQQEIEHILDVTKTMEPIAKTGTNTLKGKILATLFLNPAPAPGSVLRLQCSS